MSANKEQRNNEFPLSELHYVQPQKSFNQFQNLMHLPKINKNFNVVHRQISKQRVWLDL